MSAGVGITLHANTVACARVLSTGFANVRNEGLKERDAGKTECAGEF